jgi:hypothetical protein
MILGKFQTIFEAYTNQLPGLTMERSVVNACQRYPAQPGCVRRLKGRE